MDLRKLKTLIDLVSESNISELEITEADGKVRIVKSDPQAAQPVVYQAVPQQLAGLRDPPGGDRPGRAFRHRERRQRPQAGSPTRGRHARRPKRF